MWGDSGWGIDFRHITRLEKLVGERFEHIRDSFPPFRRAGIATVDRFLHSCLFADFENHIEERCAPEFVVHKPFFEDEEGVSDPTVKIGGLVYLDVNEDRFSGRMGNHGLVEQHNLLTGRVDALRELLHEQRWHPMMDPPLLWTSCAELADSLDNAEADGHEAWKAIQYDPVSEAFVRGWRESLHQLGNVGARAVFHFS